MAYNFNGTNQYLSRSAVTVATPPFTFAARFRCGSETNDQAIIAQMQVGNSNPDRIQLAAAGDLAGDPVVCFAGDQSLSGRASSSTAFVTNTWDHGCAVVAGAASRIVYRDGGSPGSNEVSITLDQLNSTQIGGRISNATPQLFFSGGLAEIAIWNAALTADEAKSLAKGFKPSRVRPQSLVLYMPAVRSIADIRSGAVFTNNNGATVANHPRVY
jgi:hypothetical protein